MAGYSNILVAVDFSEYSAHAIERACEIKTASSSIRLVHVTEVPMYPVLEDLAVTGMPGIWDEELTRNLIKASDKRLKQLAEQFGIDFFTTLTGTSEVEIVEYAQREKMDLIVMGFHGASGLTRLIGSTTHAIINNAPCDVLAVKPNNLD